MNFNWSISIRNFKNYIVYLITKTRIINSISTVDVVTDFCLQLIQKISLLINLNTNLKIKRLSSLLKIKSESK